MPEGPEIRALADKLQMYVGSDLVAVEPEAGGMYEGDAEFRRHSPRPGHAPRVTAVKCKGKLLWFETDGLPRVVRVKPNMDGVLTTDDSGALHVRFVFRNAAAGLDDTLWYADQSRRGRVTLDGDGAPLADELRQLGPDPLAPGGIAPEDLAPLRDSRARLPNALLNQKLVAGIGNYLRAEVVNRAGLSRAQWDRPVRALSDAEFGRLAAAIAAVPAEAYRELAAGKKMQLRAYRHKQAKHIESPAGRKFYFME